MPGLIDSHVHVILSEVNIRFLEAIPLTLMTARAARLMLGMLNRGFTSVRDTGGADWGLKTAVEQGDIPGPRLFIAGAAIGPTGGHSDAAPPHRFRRALPLLRRHALRHAAVGRRVRGDEVRARADAAGRRPHQDHDVGRRRVALRSAGQLAILTRRSRRRRAGGARLRPLRLRARLFAGSDDSVPRTAACA